MRSRLIAAGFTLALTTSLSMAQQNKGPKPDVGDGHAAWFDITTTDLSVSKPFYSGLFGWTFTSVKGYENLAAEIVSGGQAIGTLRKAEGKLSPYDGVVYIQVKDLTASCAKAKELNGQIVPGFPFNLTDDRGAIALVIDPAGHPIGMYSRTPLPKGKS
jgi:predicted enzyme related to lactoylglutathione lyase